MKNRKRKIVRQRPLRSQKIQSQVTEETFAGMIDRMAEMKIDYISEYVETLIEADVAKAKKKVAAQG